MVPVCRPSILTWQCVKNKALFLKNRSSSELFLIKSCFEVSLGSVWMDTLTICLFQMEIDRWLNTFFELKICCIFATMTVSRPGHYAKIGHHADLAIFLVDKGADHQIMAFLILVVCIMRAPRVDWAWLNGSKNTCLGLKTCCVSRIRMALPPWNVQKHLATKTLYSSCGNGKKKKLKSALTSPSSRRPSELVAFVNCRGPEYAYMRKKWREGQKRVRRASCILRDAAS